MKLSFNPRNFLLILGIFISFSNLFQIYWSPVSVSDNVLFIEGGFVQRLIIKCVGISLVYFALIRSFSVSYFAHNFAIKVPLLYYIITIILLIPILVSPDYPHSAHLMTINLVFFVPLFFLNLNGEEGDEVFEKIIKIIIWVICFQLLADLIIRWLDLHLVRTFLGGMGNANTFGLHLIIAALGIRFIYNKHLLSVFILILTFGTGSLICSLLALFFILEILIVNLFRIRFVFLILFTLLLLTAIFFWEEIYLIFLSEFGSIQHVYLKIIGLFSQDIFEVGSIKGRINWIINGLELIRDNPFSIIFGHPGFMPIYTGDGFFLALLVTLGLPALMLFLISNIYLFFRSLTETSNLYRFACYTLIVYLTFFMTNRILDYWPSGFVYLLVFSYLCRKKIVQNEI